MLAFVKHAVKRPTLTRQVMDMHVVKVHCCHSVCAANHLYLSWLDIEIMGICTTCKLSELACGILSSVPAALGIPFSRSFSRSPPEQTQQWYMSVGLDAMFVISGWLPAEQCGNIQIITIWEAYKHGFAAACQRCNGSYARHNLGTSFYTRCTLHIYMFSSTYGVQVNVVSTTFQFSNHKAQVREGTR